jgi:hypothetical protein
MRSVVVVEAAWEAVAAADVVAIAVAVAEVLSQLVEEAVERAGQAVVEDAGSGLAVPVPVLGLAAAAGSALAPRDPGHLKRIPTNRGIDSC